MPVGTERMKLAVPGNLVAMLPLVSRQRFGLSRCGFLLHILACFALGWALLPANALARDYIGEKAYWTDTDGSASFEQARQQHYTPYSGVLSKGFGSQVQWVRLRIDGVLAEGPRHLVLRIRPVYLDRITLFDPADPNFGRVVRETGDLTPRQDAEFDSLNHTFVIPAQAASREVWLRLATTSTQMMHVEAFTQHELLRAEHSLWLVYSALLGFIFSFFVLGFLAWLRDRDAVNGIFIIRQLLLLLYTASYLGYYRIMLQDFSTPAAQDLFYSALVILSTVTSVGFEFRLMSEYVFPRWGRYLMGTLLGAAGAGFLLLLFGVPLVALHLNMFIIIVGLTSFFVLSLSLRTGGQGGDAAGNYQLPLPALRAYYLTILLTLSVTILPGLGLTSATTLSIYGVLFYSVLSGLLMTTLLIVRSRQKEQMRLEVANKLYFSREQLALETRRREDQSQLLNMLMHELKTPLSVIDLAMKNHVTDTRTQGYVGRAIESMKAILDRCVQTGRLVDRPFQLSRQRADLARQLPQWLQENKAAEGRWSLESAASLIVNTDVQCLGIIVGNLLENAIKYGDPQQPVKISLQRHVLEDGRAGCCITVGNAPGPVGWPDGEKIFSKYYRSNAAQRLSGTGLGLFLSHSLARQLGGALSYRPDPQNICFELWLPISASS